MPRSYDAGKQLVLDKDPTRGLTFGGLASDEMYKAIGESILKMFEVTLDDLWRMLGFDIPPETPEEYLDALVDFIVQTAMGITTWLASQIPGLDATKITSGLFPQSQIDGLEQELSDLGAAIASGDPSAIIEAITGIVDGTNEDLENWSDNLHAMLGLPPLNDAIFDAGASVEQFIIDMLHPQNLLAPLVSGVVPGTNIPALDASKITSGQFPQSMLNIVSIAAGIVTGVFTTGQIPSLDASKISSGIFAQSMVDIRNIASSIVTGVFPAAQIGSLDASKVNTGIFPQSQLSITSIAASIVNGTFLATQIPALDASKVNTGIFPQSQLSITSIAASIVNGTFTSTQIPSLDASKIGSGQFAQSMVNITNIAAGIVSGVLGVPQIPPLDATKITSGSFGQSMVTNLTTDLSERLLKSVGVSAAQSASNLVIDPGFDNPDVWLYEKGVMDTAQKVNGTQSRRMTADGTLQSIYTTACGGPGTGPVWMVKPGQQYYVEVSVFPKATNVGGGTMGTIGAVWDSTNTLGFNYIVGPAWGPPPPKGQWTVFSGISEIPAGYDGWIQFLTLNSDVPVGDQFYWDRLIIKEIARVGNTPDLQSIADHILNGLVGGRGYTGAGTGALPDMSRGGLDQIYSEVQGHTAALQAIASEEQAIDNSGIYVNLDFSDYPDGNLPSIFSVTYSGAGTSLAGITSGTGGWRTKVNDGNKSARASYNVAPTNSDYQVIRGTLGGLPEQGGSGGAPKIGVMGRLNSTSAPTTFVWGRGYCTGFLTYKGEMGCTVNNVETVWVSNVSLDWSTDIRCVFGVGTQPRRYQFFSGSKMVYDQVEVGTASGLGAGFRYFGMTMDIRTVASGTPKVPGTLAAANISDNAPPTTVGSGGSMYRTLTALTQIKPGVNTMDNNFFNVMRYCSADIVGDLVNGTFKVTKSGFYIIRWNIQGNGSASGNVAACLFVNGTGIQFGESSSGNQAYGGTYLYYLNEQDVVKPGYYWSGSIASNYWKGDTTGTWTHFEICLANRSLK